ncbi:MAG: phosphoglycolate phosphatase [Actinomycetota bacterium]|nr:phosphoglycolate phosphatase [Actinomycetota bacterium]
MQAVTVLVLWDLDRTLADHDGVQAECYDVAFALLTGKSPQSPPRVEGRADYTIMENLLVSAGLNPSCYPVERRLEALAQAGEQLREEFVRRSRLRPGAAACLEILSTRPGLVQSVITGSIEANARIRTQSLGLDRWLDQTVGAYGSEQRPLARLVPVAQEKAHQTLGFDPRQGVTVLVGDSPLQVQTGLRGGARVVAVAGSGSGAEELKAAGADLALPGFEDPEDFLRAVLETVQMGPTEPRV